MSSFQAESKKSGNHFEEMVEADLISRGFDNIQKNVYIPEIGCEFDFVATGPDGIEYVEAKGGWEGEGKRPGAKRTDSVKKAIANCALMWSFDSNNKRVIYFSSEPKEESSSDIMLKRAISSGFVTDIYYLPRTNIKKIITEYLLSEESKLLLDRLGSDYDENGIPYWEKWQ